MRLSTTIYSLVPLCLATVPALAGSVSGSVSAMSGESDNATKTHLEPISERQDEYQLSLALDYQRPLLIAEANYLASERRFAEESQVDKSYLDGKSSLYLGNPDLPADLLIKHSRRVLLQEPDQLQLTNNLDERDIISVMPTLRRAITDVDALALTGDYTRVSFAENASRDSSRRGGVLQWVHALSPVDSLRLVGQHVSIEFDAQPLADYQYQNVYLLWQTGLRALNYSIQVGYNQSDNETQGEFDAPSYSATLNYQEGAHAFDLSVTQQITDSSLGDGNTNSVDSMPGSDGSATIHQLERLVIESRWTTTMFCVRCSVYLMYRGMDDDYITANESARQTTGGAGFSYQFSRAVQLTLSAENSRRKFNENLISNSYELSRIRLNFDYQFSHHLHLNVLAWREDREKDEPLQGYTENYAGMGLAYHF